MILITCAIALCERTILEVRVRGLTMTRRFLFRGGCWLHCDYKTKQKLKEHNKNQKMSLICQNFIELFIGLAAEEARNETLRIHLA